MAPLTIDEKSRIQLFAVIAALPVFVSIIFWLTSLYDKAVATELHTTKVEARVDAQGETLHDIRERLIRIETLLRGKHP